MYRRTLHRAALALALVAACGQFLSISHLLLVQHTVCAEHGELIHLEAGPGSFRRGGHGVHGERDAASSAYRPDGGGENADPHDHCLVSVLRRETLAVHPAASAWLPPMRTQRGVGAFENETATPRAVAILDLAPKSSPPHSA